MKSILLAVIFMGAFFGSSCGLSEEERQEKANEIMKKVIAFHGGDSYEDQGFKFVFRGGEYSFVHFSDGRYAYTSSKKNKDGKLVEVFMTNGDFIYKVGGEETKLEAKKENAIKNSLNSVVYFASLPYKLQDKSVSLKYNREVKIKGASYEEIEIRFAEQGGGDDHSDVYHYWVNKETYKIDYLAYVYHTGKGGVRFREAYNDRRVAGVLFQDYNNYKADKTTPLADLPAMLEKGELDLLSKIETEDVQVDE